MEKGGRGVVEREFEGVEGRSDGKGKGGKGEGGKKGKSRKSEGNMKHYDCNCVYL